MRKPPEIPAEVALCASEAFIDRKQYELQDPPADDQAFEQWQADIIKKYPALLGSYDLLNKCWHTYHGGRK